MKKTRKCLTYIFEHSTKNNSSKNEKQSFSVLPNSSIIEFILNIIFSSINKIAKTEIIYWAIVLPKSFSISFNSEGTFHQKLPLYCIVILEFLNSLSLILNRPAKSIPQYGKKRDEVTCSFGKYLINFCIMMGFARKQTMSSFKIDFILDLPVNGQYL